MGRKTPQFRFRGEPLGPMQTFFHSCDEGTDPGALLDPDRQFSTPWGEPEHGRCDKCQGAGRVRYECKSCLEDGVDEGCPACDGRVHFDGVCPACEGDGVIDRTRRRGVAVFPRLAGLYRYMAERDADVKGKVVVELEGRVSDDLDLDADAGALLAFPTEIVAVRPVDESLLRSIQERVAAEGGVEAPR